VLRDKRPLGQRPEGVRQKFPHCRRRVYESCERAEADTARTQTTNDLDQVRQGTLGAIKLPYDQDFSWPEEFQAQLKPCRSSRAPDALSSWMFRSATPAASNASALPDRVSRSRKTHFFPLPAPTTDESFPLSRSNHSPGGLLDAIPATCQRNQGLPGNQPPRTSVLGQRPSL
jgi:hypothetical protein